MENEQISMNTKIQLKDLDQIQELWEFKSSKFVYPYVGNIYKINGEMYELRYVIFQIGDDTQTTFGDFVKDKKLLNSDGEHIDAVYAKLITFRQNNELKKQEIFYTVSLRKIAS
jgi:hypothetical protein